MALGLTSIIHLFGLKIIPLLTLLRVTCIQSHKKRFGEQLYLFDPQFFQQEVFAFLFLWIFVSFQAAAGEKVKKAYLGNAPMYQMIQAEARLI